MVFIWFSCFSFLLMLIVDREGFGFCAQMEKLAVTICGHTHFRGGW